MANETIYPYGAGGTLPSNIGLVNDYVTGGANVALTAQAGKDLNEDIRTILGTDIDISSIPKKSKGYIDSSTNKYSASASNTGSFLAVTVGQKYRITAPEGITCSYAFVTSDTVSGSTTPPYVSGTSRNGLSAGSTVVVIIPDTCTYLQFNRDYGSSPHTPQSIILLDDQRLTKIEEDIDDINEHFPDISEQFDIINKDVKELRIDTDNLINGIFGRRSIIPTWTDGQGINCDTGASTSSEVLSRTDYLSVDGYEQLEITVNVSTVTTTTRGLAFYDEDYTYISGYPYPYNTSAEENSFRVVTYNIPSNAKFFRTCFYTSLLQNFSCIRIDSDSKDELYSDIIRETNEFNFEEEKPKFTIGSTEIYHHPAIEGGTTAGTTTAGMYELYDALVTAYPQWFARLEDIGTSSNNVGIRCYRIRNNENAVWTLGHYNNNVWDNYYAYRKFLINGGTHGDERSAVWGVYYFVKTLLESDDNWAMFIKSNIEIHIIPILNPYGVDNNQRRNANNVDINRQFSNNTCVETEALKNYATSLKPFAFLDCHNVSKDDGNYLGYIGTKDTHPNIGMMMRLANAMIALCQDDWSDLATAGGVLTRPYVYGCLGQNYTAAVAWIVNNVTRNAFVLEGLNVGSSSTNGKPMAKLHIDMLANLIPLLMKIAQ